MNITPEDIISIGEIDVAHAANIVRLVANKDISELKSVKELRYILEFYYSCISAMNAGRIICPVAS